jgi:hypothetical protein
MGNKWGFLRETEQEAQKAGKDKDFDLHRTGLEKYLKVIFPNTNDWVHDKAIGTINGKSCRKRPDYRSESLKLIVEFDGLPHYQNPETIEKDYETTKLYESAGYKVVRVPYFIQLSNKAVKTLFGVDVKEELFDENIPSLGIKGNCSPACLCSAGVERMAKEFKLFPEQYKTNVEYLKKQNNSFLSEVELLETAYNAKGDKK